MTFQSIPLVLLLLLISLAAPARADTLGSRQKQRGVITKLDKGVLQLGIEGTLNLNQVSEGDQTGYRTAAAGSAVLRYFLRPNLGLSARGSGIFRRAGENRDLGFLAMAWANFYIRLGEGMFVGPGAGAGLLLAERTIDGGAGSIARASLTAGALGAEFPLLVYLNERFALTAGPEFLFAVGQATPEGSEMSSSSTSIDGSIKAGVLYSF